MTQPLDLTACDKEPIHIPGSIQPHGILLAIDPTAQIIQQVAGDTETFFARRAADLLGQPIDLVLGPEAMLSLATLDPKMAGPLYLGSLNLAGVSSRKIDLTAHFSELVLVLELEFSSVDQESSPQLLGSIRRTVTVWEAADDLQDLYNLASKEFRRLTGFDRVMIYRFLENDTGVVVSEAKLESLDALLNHHYPASDIPKQARALYLRNPIRLIPDAAYTPALLSPALNPMTGDALDMSESMLRGVSPVHIQFLKNMDVAASMSVSIIVDGALWGLVSCHHTSPKHIHYELRETCKLLGRILGQLIKARQETNANLQAQQLAAERSQILQRLTGPGGVEKKLAACLEDLKRLTHADGVALLNRDRLTQVGSTPSERQTRELIEWLNGKSAPAIFATDNLVSLDEQARSYAAKASGVLAAVISSLAPCVLLWFRAEYAETINWAGNPHKAVEPGAEPGQLSPRSSFEDWKETVRHHSRPWSAVEVDSARTFGRAVIEMRMQDKLQGLNQQLLTTLTDKERLLARTEELKEEALSRVQQLHKSEVELRTILEHTSDAYIGMDEVGRVTAWNRKSEEVFLWSREEAIGRLLEELVVPSGLRAVYRRDLNNYLTTEKSEVLGKVLECSVLRKDGMLIPIELRATAVKIEGRVIFSAFLQDITERKLQEIQRLQDAQEDALTGLVNRRAMYSFLKARLGATPAVPFQLLYLDLDNFKPINDTLGHAAGDQVLVKIAERLRECVREEDLVARIGGDEFVLIVASMEKGAVIESFCDRLLRKIREPVLVEKHEVSVGCCIGIVSTPLDSRRADDLLRFADIALYEAKAAGRNTWRFYTERMSSRLVIRRQIETDLRLALRRDELRLEYQPRYDLRSGNIMGAEALVRWQHPLRGWLGPDSFISIAEGAGLITPLSDWVLRHACQEAATWENEIFVSVNLSSIEFKSGDLVSRVRNVLHQTGISPERLELEITESVMLDDSYDALATMDELKALGVRLAMDDFGTGYSSLSYIHTYPFDGIKIDRSFIAALDGSASGEAIIEAIVAMGNALTLTITAEGVETPAQLDFLTRLNCNQAQGFYMARPTSGKAVGAINADATWIANVQ